MEKICVVDEKDNVVGSATKDEALEKDLIRRITRVFIFNDKNEIFLQKRADNVVIAPGTWDQSAGGHVNAGEDYLDAAKRELKEELGVELPLKFLFKVFFEEPFRDGKILKLFNSIYVATYSDDFRFQKEEVSGGKWVSVDELKAMVENEPEKLAPGLFFSWREFCRLYPDVTKAFNMV